MRNDKEKITGSEEMVTISRAEYNGPHKPNHVPPKTREHGNKKRTIKGISQMPRREYSAQYKTKLVLEVLQGEKELGTVAYENNINSNMLRNWTREFMDHASSVFKNRQKAEKQARR